MKKDKRKKSGIAKKNILIIGLSILIIIILILIGVVIGIVKKNSTNDSEPVNNSVEKIDQMENYDYYLDENATEYYKELYNELKNVLNSEEVIDEEYAKIISKLFVTDLFTLDNKLTSSDIGGLQFVYAEFKEDFVNIAKTSLYASVKSNIYGDRVQELPIVSTVEISNIENSLFTYDNTEYESYNVTLNISYQKDLGYPVSYKLTLIKNDKYFQVVSAE